MIQVPINQEDITILNMYTTKIVNIYEGETGGTKNYSALLSQKM